MRRSRLVAVLFLLLLPAAFAQKTTGTLTGTVTDPSGAVVASANVTAVNQATNSTRKAATGAAGSFTIPELEPGVYKVTINAQGFQPVVQNNVELHVADVTTLRVQVAVGTAAQVVNVEAAGVSVNTENGEVGNVMLGNQVRELPLNGRNFRH